MSTFVDFTCRREVVGIEPTNSIEHSTQTETGASAEAEFRWSC